jgi:hypothetical protein
MTSRRHAHQFSACDQVKVRLHRHKRCVGEARPCRECNQAAIRLLFCCHRQHDSPNRVQASGDRKQKRRPHQAALVVEAICNLCRIEPFGSTTVRLRVGWWPFRALLMLVTLYGKMVQDPLGQRLVCQKLFYRNDLRRERELQKQRQLGPARTRRAEKSGRPDKMGVTSRANSLPAQTIAFILCFR